MYDSLFTYDRNTNIMQAFCEGWCPTTNTLLTSVGELSILLWNLHVICVLPYHVAFMKRSFQMLKNSQAHLKIKKTFFHQSYEHLFDAFHQLQTENKDFLFRKVGGILV